MSYILKTYRKFSLITVAVRYKVWTLFARLKAGIVGSNPTQDMDICVHLFCVCIALCVGRGLATNWPPVQGVLPIVYIGSKNWKTAKAQQSAVEP
jgi:hypothetical protein